MFLLPGYKFDTPENIPMSYDPMASVRNAIAASPDTAARVADKAKPISSATSTVVRLRGLPWQVSLFCRCVFVAPWPS